MDGHDAGDQFLAPFSQVKVVGATVLLALDKTVFLQAGDVLSDIAFGDVHAVSAGLLINALLKSYFDQQFNLVGSTLPPCGARHFTSAPFVYPDGQDRVSVIPDRVFSFEDPSVPLFNPDPGGCEFGKEVDVLPTFTQVPVDLPTLIAFCDTYRAAFLPPQVDPADVNPGQAVFVTCRNQVEFLSDFEQTWPMDQVLGVSTKYDQITFENN